MSETEQAIASLRSSIDALHARLDGLHAQAAAKEDASAVSALSSRVTSCEGRVAATVALTSRVADQAANQVPNDRDGYITGEKQARQAAEDARCRADRDMALAQRIGSVQCGLAAVADATATCTLSSRKYSEDSAEVHIKPGETVEPLRMGKFVFHGETARQIRAAQTILREAGAGLLEVVKRVNGQGEPFVVIDGQVFVSRAMVKGAVVDPVRFKVRLEVDEKGRYYAAGFGVGVEQAAGSAAEAPFDAGQLLSEITKQITESELVANLDSRIAENRSINDRLTSLSLDLVTAKSRADQRIEALQAQIDNLQGKIYS